jgi:hypothetical protein
MVLLLALPVLRLQMQKVKHYQQLYHRRLLCLKMSTSSRLDWFEPYPRLLNI